VRVKCIADKLSTEQLQTLGPELLSQEFHLRVGQEYLVNGLQFRFGGRGGIGVWIEYETELGYLGFGPMVLFEVANPTVSRLWQFSFASEGTALLEPPSFRQEFYFDDLSSGVESVLRDFEAVKRTLSSE
jgi:hypothetical protein